MAHGKETPRQKMIGMMYLVLTALLALNVAKSVLDAFLVVNTGLQATNKSFKSKSAFLYSEIEKQKLINETKVKPVADAAARVAKWAIEMDEYVQEIKKELVIEVEKVDEEAADSMAIMMKYVKNKDNYDVPTHMLLGTDVLEIDKCKARELKDKLNIYKNNLIGELENDAIKLIDKKGVIEQLGDIGIDTEDNPDAKDDHPEEKFWEYKKFYHAPVYAVITILTQIQSEILNAEAVVVEKLYSSITASDFKFNTLKAIVIPNTDYVIQGNNFEARIFLAAYDTTQPPDIHVGDFGEVDGILEMKGTTQKLDVDDENRGIYSKKETSLGDKTLRGLIQLKAPTGEIRKFPFEKKYQVAPPNLIVSAIKMKVFYLAIDNPVGISMPGVDKITASIDNGTIKPDGKDWVVVPAKPGSAKVTVYAVVDGERRPLGSVPFKVKRVPDPVPMVGGMSGGMIQKSLLTALDGVYAVMPEWFDFELTYKVTGFTVSYTDKGGFLIEEESKNNKFTAKQKNLFNKLGRGSKVYFEDIQAVGPDGSTRKLGTMSFKLK